MTDKVVVFTTCGSAESAARIARGLIDSRLAACVNVVSGVRSFYRWKGKVEDDAEHLLVIKSSRPRVDALQAEIEKLHDYELPEMIVLPIVDGSPNYLNWLETELREAAE